MANNSGSGNDMYKNVIMYGLLFIAIIALYYLYNFLFGTSSILTVQLLNTQTNATAVDQTKIPSVPKPLEGGEYTVSMWVYISSFRNPSGSTAVAKKSLFELGGSNFDTLLIALGANVNKLIVRVNTKDQGVNAPLDPTDTSLTTADIVTLMKTLVDDDSHVCDIPEIDLQRWILINVVLNGRTVDTYIDGKLARSCTLPHVFRVDSTPVSVSLCDGGGFDGYLNTTSVSNYALNPDEVYRMYSAGPTGGGFNPLGFVSAIFTPRSSI